MHDPGDEERFVAYGAALVDAIDAVVEGWVRGCVVTRCSEAGVVVDDAVDVAATTAGERCRAEVVSELRVLMATDVDEQARTPLQVLRSAVSFPTEVLRELGVPPIERDDFDERAFPDDPYGLTPAGFVDVDPSLTDAGIAWGAAKAHLHRSRHSG